MERNLAHCDERNLAHCAGNNSTENGNMAKLKEDYERQIQTLKLEHKIQLLEMDNTNKTKIMEATQTLQERCLALEKENQALKHENQIMKLKSEHESDLRKSLIGSDNHVTVETLRNDIEGLKANSKNQQPMSEKLSNLEKTVATLRNDIDGLA
uniref:Uncharacterized protein n=1 Tax=Clytia hemisphaerica TaxID=252671 RepID=A0A7M6DP59_9CNID